MSNNNMRLTIVTPSRLLILCCVLFLLVPGSSAPAQVILRDTVRIQDQLKEFQEREAGAMSADEVVFVAPRAGVLQIIPTYAQKIDGPTPDSAYLRIILPDTTCTTLVLPYFNENVFEWASTYDTCAHPPMYIGFFNYLDYWSIAPERYVLHAFHCRGRHGAIFLSGTVQ